MPKLDFSAHQNAHSMQMKTVIRNFVLVLTLAVALPAFAQRGPGDGGGSTGGGGMLPGTMYYIGEDSCRQVLESKMSTEDAAALEAAVTDFRNADKQLADLRVQIEAAMKAGDKDALAQLQLQAQTLQQQQQTDLNTINTLLAKYQADAEAVMRDCHPAKDGGPGMGDSNRGHKRGGDMGRGPNPRMRFDAGFFVGHDTCRWALEAKMSDADAQAFEAAALAIQADDQQMRDLMKQIREAFRAHDSATVASLRSQIDALRTKGKADRDAYMQILKKYADQIGAVRKECWTPIRPDGRRDKGTTGGNGGHILEARPLYPNPVKAGDVVTLEYVLSADADVNITLNNAMGTTLQQVTTGSEVAGSYKTEINTSGLEAGGYYVRIQAGTNVQTLKFAVVQ